MSTEYFGRVESGYLSPAQAAQYLGIGRSTLYHYLKLGKLPQPVRIGTRPRWRKSDLDKFLHPTEK